MSLILREFEWKICIKLGPSIFGRLSINLLIFINVYIHLCTSCLLLPECYLLVFRIENAVDGWDISYSKMPRLSMLAGLSRHEAKFPGNFSLDKENENVSKIQIDVCSANYQFEEIWNIVLRQKTLET